MVAWIWVGAVVAAGVAWAVDRRRRRFADLPTTPAAAVFAGRNEVVGRAWAPHPTVSHRARVPSVWWVYVHEEERRHTRQVTTTDSKGNTSSRTETYMQWHEIDRRAHHLPELEVVDETGSAVVRLDGAKVVPRELHSGIYDGEREGGFLARMFDDRTGRYRETETGIAVGDRLFVVGETRLDETRLVPVLHDEVLVSTRSESSHRSWLGAAAAAALLAATGLTTVAIARTIAPDEPGRPTAWLPGVGVVALALALAWGSTTYNRLRLVAQGVDRAWSLIDVQLRRRHDLIPALAEVVRAHAEHEATLLAATADARRAGPPARLDTAAAVEAESDQQTTDLRPILAIAESHPQLTADDAYLSLVARLSDTEDRIAGSRTFYNDSLTLLADRRERFPDSLIARRLPLPHRELLRAECFERTVPPVRRDLSPT